MITSRPPFSMGACIHLGVVASVGQAFPAGVEHAPHYPRGVLRAAICGGDLIVCLAERGDGVTRGPRSSRDVPWPRGVTGAAPASRSRLPLYWRVFATNAAVLTLAFLGLVFAPVTVSIPPAAAELAVLVAGLIGLLAMNLLLLSPAFRPLDELADTMRRHDPLSPGARARVDGEPDVAALADAFNEMLDRLEGERRESARRALMIQEGERRRIARELHDEVGQTLTGVMLQVEGLAPAIPENLHEQFDELRETARRGTEDVRRIASRLRPEALEDLGLQSALAALASAFGEQARVRVHRRLEPALSLSDEQELVVYRVAQEALTNIARHAGATHVDLWLRREGSDALLTVRDDGRGLSTQALSSSSHGIRGMRERAMLIDAPLTIGTPPGGGTEVELRIPMRRDTR